MENMRRSRVRKTSKNRRMGIWLSCLIMSVAVPILLAARHVTPLPQSGIWRQARVQDKQYGISIQEPRQERISKAEVNKKIAKLHIPFIVNQGQTDERVKFYAHTFGGTVFITEDGEIVYSLPNIEDKRNGLTSEEKITGFDPQSSILNPQPTRGIALKEEIVSERVKKIKGEGEAITKVSYFKGNDPSKWKSNIPTYSYVSLGEVYKGIELKFKAYGNNVEKLFFVKPGAASESIKVKLRGEVKCKQEWGA